MTSSIVSQLRPVPFSVASKAVKYKYSAEELAEFRKAGIDAISEHEESSLGAFDIEAQDQLVLCCRSGAVGEVDLLVFDQVDGNFYVHHTVDLPFLPLNVSVTNFTPKTGEMCAYFIVSGFSTASEIFKLNCLDQNQPDFYLSEPLIIEGAEEGEEENERENQSGNREGDPENDAESYEDFEEYEEREEVSEYSGFNAYESKNDNFKQIPAPDGPRGPVTCGDVNADFPNLFACGSADGNIYFYDLSSLAVLKAIRAHQNGVGHIYFKGQKMTSAGLEDATVCFFDFTIEKEKPLKSVTLNADTEAMAILEIKKSENQEKSGSNSQNETKIIITDQKGHIYIFDTTGTLLMQKKIAENPLTGLAARVMQNPKTMEHKTIIAASSVEESVIYLLNIDLTPIIEIRDLQAYSLLFLNDIYLLSGSGTGKVNAINIWNRISPQTEEDAKKAKFKDKQINLYSAPNDME